MKHFLPRDLKCHIFPVVTFWWQNAAVLWKQLLLFTLSLLRTSVTRCTFRGLSCLWRITLRHTGNSFEELWNQVSFFPWLEQGFSYKVHDVLVLFCMKPSLPKPGCESRSKRVYARRWGRSFLWLKVMDPISGGDIPWTDNNNQCQCLEWGRNLALCEWLKEKGCFYSEVHKDWLGG